MTSVHTLWAIAIISIACHATTMTLAFVQDYQASPVRGSVANPYSFPVFLANKDDDSDPDLFEYFDPLLSPHAYPSGVSPDKKPEFASNDEIQEELQRGVARAKAEGSKPSFGIRLPTTEGNGVGQTSAASSAPKGVFGFDVDDSYNSDSETTVEDDKEDLFDYFDPLRSPHEYPDGIQSKKKSMESMTVAPPSLEVVDSNSGKSKKKIGVLLMDHGSKKEKSNARLQEMARLYQLTLGYGDDDSEDETTPTIIVRAAHMEIATPSIPERLKELKELGVDEIICHPFFLSADGRHVKEDIPQIINDAIEDLWGENKSIPIVTTPPVGSNTQLMLGAIHSLVRENSQYLKTSM